MENDSEKSVEEEKVEHQSKEESQDESPVETFPETGGSIMTGKDGKKRKKIIKKLQEQVKSFDYRFKVVVIGTSGSGKTSLLLRFAENKFNDDHLVTIGVDFKTKSLQVGQKTINLQLWDTAGQEKYKSVTRSYYKNSHGALAIYDITDRNSLAAAEKLIRYYKDESESQVPGNVVLVGNKFDLATKHREVSEEEGKRIAEGFGIPFFEVSAKKGTNVDDAFFEAAMQAMRDSKLADEELDERDKIKLKQAYGEDVQGGKKKKKKLKFPKMKCIK